MTMLYTFLPSSREQRRACSAYFPKDSYRTLTTERRVPVSRVPVSVLVATGISEEASFVGLRSVLERQTCNRWALLLI